MRAQSSRELQEEIAAPAPATATPRANTAVAGAMGNRAFAGFVASTRPVIARDKVTVLPELTIVAGPQRALTEEAHERASEAQQGSARVLSWGAAQTTTSTGAPNTADAVTANAKKRGVGPELEGLSQDVDMLRPLVLAWVGAGATVKTISDENDITPGQPDLYKGEVEAMGKAMANTRDATGKAALDAFGRGKARVDSHDLSASTERLNQAANTILTVKAKLEQYRSRLEQMRLNAEIAKEQDKLKAIQEKIQLISDVITKVATVAAAVTGAIAASSAAAAAAEVGAETTETLGSLGVASDGKNYDRASTGLGKVAEGGGVISGFLTYFVFDKEIEKIQGEITRLQGEVAKLQASDLKIDGENLGRDLSSARSAYKEAADKLAESKSSFSNAMQEAGRTWDQRGLTAKQADARGPDAEPGGKGKGASKFSMEAILYMAAALQARKSARRAVSNLFDQLPRLSMAQDIALRALDSNTVGIVPVDVGGGKRMGVMAGVPIDFVPDAKFEPGRAGPSDQTRLDAAAVRRTTDSVAQVQTILEGHGPRQEAEEDDFMAMVSKGTGRKIQ